jgi:Fe-S cluster assembly protein SufD
MLDLQTRPHSLIDNWAALRGVLGASGTASLDTFRQEGFRRFSEVGLPTIKDEEFKYISLRELDETRFVAAYGATVGREELASNPLAAFEAYTVVFVNGQYAPELSTVQVLPEGAFIGSIEDAFEQGIPAVTQLGRIATLEGRLGTTNDERFVHLNNAYLSEGACVYLPKGTALEQPVHILYLSKADHGTFAAFPRTLIVLEQHSDAKIVETYLGLQGTYFNDAVTEVFLGKDGMLEHTLYQAETGDAFHIKTVATHQEEGSIYTSNNANFGGRLVRSDLNVFIDGEHTETWLNGASIGTGHQIIDNHTRLDHAKPNCNSFEVYKSILRDRATGVFNGKIFVYEDAQKTDAKQTNQGILLSPTATFDTKPQLEIFADDVKCTHGATVGQLRSDAMFYLRQRGIPEKQAQALLVYAFAAEVLEKISISVVREALEKVLFDKLNETEALPEG